MRVTAPKASARIGRVEIRGVQRVVELEALETSSRVQRRTHSSSSSNKTQAVPPSAINAIQSRTAIVVPCKDESLDHIQGVWAAIPASSLIILVSGSETTHYAVERAALTEFCANTGRSGMAIHQRDPKVADALRTAGMQELLDDAGDGLVHKGKGEALVVGIALAATARGPETETAVACGTDGSRECCGSQTSEMTGVDARYSGSCTRMPSHGEDTKPLCNCNAASTRGNGPSWYCHDRPTKQDNSGHHAGGAPGYYKYIGFVDADNFVPGSVQEYCRAFSAGMHLAQAEDAMVRINWSSKPKVENGKLHFKPSGRSSEIVNRWLNRLLNKMDASIVTAIDQAEENQATTDLICTGNAGEHAMTISLALKLRVAAGYAIEPFHFLDIFERFAGEPKDEADGADKALHQLEESSTAAAVVFDDEVPEMPLSPETSPSATPLDFSPMLSACEESTVPTSPSIFATAFGKVPAVKRLPPPLASTAAYQRAVVQGNIVQNFTPPESPIPGVSPAKVQILQIRTINPHFHDNKGDDHVVRMWKQGLSAIYHAPVAATLEQYREELRTATFGGGEHEGVPTPPFSNSASVATSPTLSVADTVKNAAVIAAAGWQPAKCRIYPSPGSMDLWKLRDQLEQDEGSFWWSGMADEFGATAGESDSASGLSIDLLGLGPVSLERRPENDVDGFKACVDEGR
ncbi:unnamed protein product [Discula destructiva]